MRFTESARAVWMSAIATPVAIKIEFKGFMASPHTQGKLSVLALRALTKIFAIKYKRFAEYKEACCS